MSEPATPGAPAPSAAPTAPAPPTTAPPPAGAQPAPATPPAEAAATSPDGDIKLTSEQLKQRLDRQAEATRRELLASLGVDDPEKAKAAIAAAREREEADKTLEQRLADQKAQHEADRVKLSAYEATIKARAEAELASLTDAQRAAVAAIAGEDPADKLRTIDALKPTWSAAPAGEAPPGAPARPPAASTAPPRDAPGDGTPAPTDHKAHYERLKAENPLAAGLYLNAHRAQIYPG